MAQCWNSSNQIKGVVAQWKLSRSGRKSAHYLFWKRLGRLTSAATWKFAADFFWTSRFARHKVKFEKGKNAVQFQVKQHSHT
jgi:hypothetical protein